MVTMDGNVMMGGGAAMADNKVFPSAISVQRLAPQVQRQLRETQELIKDSCQGLVYGSPGPPMQQQPQPKNPSAGPPPPPPQRTSTLRKNVNATVGGANASTASAAVGPVATNNTSFETHPQDYSWYFVGST